ncbi:MAG: LacI family DNA-binding transcriptional regulator [Rhodobacteraceae bacterium]|jgi:LacI family transcriptional regulator|nr:LacI family DNA-binding transcriptional regulator [Paracoccaceae bacterium]
MMRPTIKSIAALTGYSVGTVSNALRNDPSVKTDTREEIQDLARKQGYEANLEGVKLRTGKTLRLAVLINTFGPLETEWEGIEFSHILGGIAKSLQGTRYQMGVYAAVDFESSFAEIRRIVNGKLADGLIFSGTLPDDPRIAFLQENAFPFVTYGMSRSAIEHSYVDIDSESTAFDATHRLITLGHRRIAFFNPPETLMYAQQRIAGYARAHREAVIPIDQALIQSGQVSAQFGKAKFLELANSIQPPTAYICANEALALGILAGAGDVGQRPGIDFVVNSMDDLTTSAYFTPPLTTFHVPIMTTSLKLGEFLMRAIAGEPPHNLQLKIRPRLIERQSDELGVEPPATNGSMLT